MKVQNAAHSRFRLSSRFTAIVIYRLRVEGSPEVVSRTQDFQNLTFEMRRDLLEQFATFNRECFNHSTYHTIMLDNSSLGRQYAQNRRTCKAR